jgi:hypothetical protein
MLSSRYSLASKTPALLAILPGRYCIIAFDLAHCEKDRLRNKSAHKVLSTSARCEKVLLYYDHWQ